MCAGCNSMRCMKIKPVLSLFHGYWWIECRVRLCCSLFVVLSRCYLCPLTSAELPREKIILRIFLSYSLIVQPFLDNKKALSFTYIICRGLEFLAFGWVELTHKFCNHNALPMSSAYVDMCPQYIQ